MCSRTGRLTAFGLAQTSCLSCHFMALTLTDHKSLWVSGTRCSEAFTRNFGKQALGRSSQPLRENETKTVPKPTQGAGSRVGSTSGQASPWAAFPANSRLHPCGHRMTYPTSWILELQIVLRLLLMPVDPCATHSISIFAGMMMGQDPVHSCEFKAYVQSVHAVACCFRLRYCGGQPVSCDGHGFGKTPRCDRGLCLVFASSEGNKLHLLLCLFTNGRQQSEPRVCQHDDSSCRSGSACWSSRTRPPTGMKHTVSPKPARCRQKFSCRLCSACQLSV